MNFLFLWKIKKNLTVGLTLGLLGYGSISYALSTNYAEVLIENLKIGGEYNLTKLLNMPLIIGSNRQENIKVKLEVLRPQPNGLKKGFESIPDSAWLRINHNPADGIVEVLPKSQYKTDLLVCIPNEREYLGKAYQVEIRASELNQGSGLTVAFSVTARLLFTIAPVVEDFHAEKSISLNYGFKPEKVFIGQCSLNRSIELDSPKQTILLVNASDQQITVELESIAPDLGRVRLEPGYEIAPHPEFLTFKNTEITLKPNSQERIFAALFFPDAEAYHNKKYQFFVAAKTGKTTVGRQLLRVLVETK